MPSFPAENGVKITIGCVCGVQRFQSVLKYVADGAWSSIGPFGDFGDYLVNTLFDVWRGVLATDCYISGFSLEGFVRGYVIPYKQEYDTTTWPGTRPGSSSPPNSSMLIVGYSVDQAALPNKRTSTSKIFVGPAPDEDQEGGTLDNGFYNGDFDALVDALQAGFTGGTTAANWKLAINYSDVVGTDIYVADKILGRQTCFTQRRRMTPIL